MQQPRIALIGVGATGMVLAAAILSRQPEAILVVRNTGAADTLLAKGINVSGGVDYQCRPTHVVSEIKALKDVNPDIIFLATKTFHLEQVLEELAYIYRPGTRIICTQNGLGPEDLFVDKFGPGAVFRMSLNYGASIDSTGEAAVAFFNRPNHLGGFAGESAAVGVRLAELLTDSGLDTAFVDDIKLQVWKKMIMKCTMASICALTNKTIKAALEFGPTREIADACFKEALAVAKAVGYDIDASYIDQAVAYLMKAGVHRDSICNDIENQRQTEIDFLGGKIVEYAHQNNVPVPFYTVMTNLVKTIEDGYLT